MVSFCDPQRVRPTHQKHMKRQQSTDRLVAPVRSFGWRFPSSSSSDGQARRMSRGEKSSQQTYRTLIMLQLDGHHFDLNLTHGKRQGTKTCIRMNAATIWRLRGAISRRWRERNRGQVRGECGAGEAWAFHLRPRGLSGSTFRVLVPLSGSTFRVLALVSAFHTTHCVVL